MAEVVTMKTFRYSEINTAYTCLQKYKYIYVDKLRMDTASADMHFGTAVHVGIKAHFEGNDPIAVFDMYWNSVKDDRMKYTSKDWKQLQEMGKVFLTRWVRRESKYYKPLFIEETIKAPLGQYMLEGTPDFVGYFDDMIAIVDWKTSAREYDKKKIKVNEQMYMYAYMVQEALKLDVKKLVYCVFIKLPEPRIQTIEIDLTADKLKDMIDNVKLMCEDLSQRTAYPKNRNSCGYCEFYSNCYGDK